MSDDLTTLGYFLDEYITEQGSERVVFRIPECLKIKINEGDIKTQFEDVRSVDIGLWSNGDLDVKIYLKQLRPSACGRIMIYE